MSDTVLIIAGLHALPPIIGAIKGRFLGLFIGTAVGVGMAFLLGGGRYTGIDLVGVALGFWIGWIGSK